MEHTVEILGLKSARIIENPDEISRTLHEADENVRRESSRESVNPSTVLEEDEDGRTKVRKVFSSSVDPAAKILESDIKQWTENVKIPWEDAYASRVIPYWASDERVDRHGDIVRQSWNFDNFKLNPVVPYSHNWDLPPVGNSIHWEVLSRSDDNYTGPALRLFNLFATAETWEFADTIFRLAKTGFLKASSVGFYPGTVINVEDEEERSRLGLGRWGYILDNNELIEHSPCTIPANPGAVSLLRAAKSKGMLKSHDVMVIRDLERARMGRGEGDSARWKERDAAWRTIWGSLFPSVKLTEHKELDVPIALEVPEVSSGALLIEIRSLKDAIQDVRTTADDTREAVEDLRNKIETTSTQTKSPSVDGDRLDVFKQMAANLEKAAVKLGGKSL